MRTLIFKMIVFSGLVFLALSLFSVQLVQGGRFRKLSEQNRIRVIPLEAPRGRILDRDGRVLATNRSSFDVVATPEDVTPEVYTRLAKILNLPEAEIRKRMRAPREHPFAPALIQEDVPKDLAFQIEERKPELPGVATQISFIRYYPYQETASHILGFIGKVNQQEYERLNHERYGMNSLIGRAGIEKVYDDRLRGWRGGRQIEVNARGEMMRVLSESLPEPGEDIKLTIQAEFQKKIMESMKDKHASVAVLDLDTNDILALASTPAFDPNVFVSPGKEKERMKFLKDAESPLLDRGVSSAYPPGSVFKLVTAIAGLETGKITPNTRFFCKGTFQLGSSKHIFKCWNKEGHGSLNLYEALERSCNVYFYNLGRKLSAEEISHYARELGLGEKIQLDATNIAPGLVPDSAWKEKKLHQKWYQGETISFAIGQSYLLVSPVQVLRLVAILAKNGVRVEPRLLMDEKKPAGNQKLAIREENIKVVKKGMLQVVQSDYGTGQLARVDFAKMAAKTGTAQAPPKKAHGWFTGFFPYEQPKIAFVAFVEHGGSGGVAGAKIVKDMIEAWRADVQKMA